MSACSLQLAAKVLTSMKAKTFMSNDKHSIWYLFLSKSVYISFTISSSTCMSTRLINSYYAKKKFKQSKHISSKRTIVKSSNASLWTQMYGCGLWQLTSTSMSCQKKNFKCNFVKRGNNELLPIQRMLENHLNLSLTHWLSKSTKIHDLQRKKIVKIIHWEVCLTQSAESHWQPYLSAQSSTLRGECIHRGECVKERERKCVCTLTTLKLAASVWECVCERAR